MPINWVKEVIKIARAYYGDQISKNMIETSEGYLICKDVRIGRIGSMDYLGSELPADFNEPYDRVCKVSRTKDELFSEETIASFEFKSVTNTHPKNNLDINTVEMSEKGQISNVRPDGDYLIADLCIKDPLLIDQVRSGKMREVSCGYDCSWHKVSDGKYEQREIRGNHVALVRQGRAGHKVAIQDQKPNTKGSKLMGKMSKSFLTALGFKHYAMDAEPEEIAKAMDSMQEEDKKECKDEEPEKTGVATDAEAEASNAKIAGLESKLDSLISIVQALVQSDKEVHKEVNDAKSAMDALEEEMGDKEDKKEEAKDEEPETKEEEKKEDVEKKAPANDSAFRKLVQDMKPLIMAIEDEKTRNAMALKFTSSVRDARANTNGYADIATTVAKNKKQAMDSTANKGMTVSEKAEKACNAWNKSGETMKGGSY